MLYENVAEGEDGLVVSISGSSPTWLLNMVSAGVRAKDWRAGTKSNTIVLKKSAKRRSEDMMRDKEFGNVSGGIFG